VTKKKTPARTRLSLGHRHNPWRSTAPSPAELLLKAIASLQIAQQALLDLAQLEETARSRRPPLR
jgi:hypothetical protein